MEGPIGLKSFGGLVLCLLSVTVLTARAEESATALSNFWDRPTMLGGPGSPREALANAGIDINAWLTQTYEGIISRDGPHEWLYGGKATVTGTLDGKKLGLWSGLPSNVIYEQVH